MKLLNPISTRIEETPVEIRMTKSDFLAGKESTKIQYKYYFRFDHKLFEFFAPFYKIIVITDGCVYLTTMQNSSYNLGEGWFEFLIESYEVYKDIKFYKYG